jgi:branched-chain amino acid transport system permease protein
MARGATTTHRLELVLLVALVLYPFAPVFDWAIHAATGAQLGLDRALGNIVVFAILALGLNIQVGSTGLLQLGIAAFFAIGAFTTGLVTVEKYPFQIGFWGALVVAPAVAGVAGLALGAPTLRLRGDYLAIVTLGFGELVRVVLLNFEAITDGPRGLNPIPAPWVPDFVHAWAGRDVSRVSFLTVYYVALVVLVALVIVMANLDRSRLGRTFVALREDELASACMNRNPVHTRLIAFATGAAIAGLAGVFYATLLTTTAEPNTYDFNYSVMVLCCLIVGGLGSLRGVLLGSAVLLGFDSVLAPLVTRLIQGSASGDADALVFARFSNWRLFIFGAALVLMMRFRPEGLWPSSRIRAELHRDEVSP